MVGGRHGPPDEADDPLSTFEMVELTALVDRAGEAMSVRLLQAVAGVDGLHELNLVTKREYATLRIALAVAAAD